MKIKEKIAKLIDVKSIMTLTLTIVFAYLSVTEKISTEQYSSIFTAIIGFYFGIQNEKKNNNDLKSEQKGSLLWQF